MSRKLSETDHTNHVGAIYLDNNATTFMPDVVKSAIIAHMDQGNPSSNYPLAIRSSRVIETAKDYIAKVLNINRGDYSIIFTSCASESNNFILKSAAEAYKQKRRVKPHIIISSIEHKTSLTCANYLVENEIATVSIVAPTIAGDISAASIDAEIKKHKDICLISIIHGNNETGIINDIAAIGLVAHNARIPFHTDAVQTFGKGLVSPRTQNVDSLSISFHKLYGPTGIGAIIITNKFINGYNIRPLICGAQNGGMRGGTEPVFLIAGALAAMQYTFGNRAVKNTKLQQMKNELLQQLVRPANKITVPFTVCTWSINMTLSRGFNIIVLGGSNNTLPNALMFSLVYVSKESPLMSEIEPNGICNLKMQECMKNNHVIVATGSACNKGTASHVAIAMKLPQQIRKGLLRVTFGDSNTLEEIPVVVKVFRRCACEILYDEIQKGNITL